MYFIFYAINNLTVLPKLTFHPPDEPRNEGVHVILDLNRKQHFDNTAASKRVKACSEKQSHSKYHLLCGHLGK